MWYLTELPEFCSDLHTQDMAQMHTCTLTRAHRLNWTNHFIILNFSYLTIYIPLPAHPDPSHTHPNTTGSSLCYYATTPEDAACLRVWLDRLSVSSRHQLHSSWSEVDWLCVHINFSILESPSGTNFCRSCACCHNLCEFIYAIKILFNDTCKAVPKAHSLKCIHHSNSAVLTVLAVDKRKYLPYPHYLR